MLSQTNLNHIPHAAWVYIFKDYKAKILYIGKAKNLNKRVHQYFSPWSVRKQDMMSKADSVEFVVVDNEWEALILESNMIKQHLPAYNRLLKWDNSYVYIKITAEPWPQIIFTRTRKEDGAIYIGPKHMRNELKKLLQYLRQLLWYRWCKTTQFRQGKLCSDYLFGICKWRCVYAKLDKNIKKIKKVEGVQEAETTPQITNKYLADAIKLWFPADATYQSWQQQSKRMIQLIVDLFDGNSDTILKHIKAQIKQSIESENYEYAAKLRDIYHNIDALTTKQSVILDPQIHGTYAMIQLMWWYWVYVILTLHHGKLVDILRFKESVDEVNLEQIKLQIEIEYSTKNKDPEQEIRKELQDNINEWRFSKILQPSAFPLHRDSPLFSLQPLQYHALKFIENFIISDSRQTNSVMNDLLAQLQSRYWLSQYPYRIECIDISHLSGWWASGGLSCLVGGMPDKKFYRQYKIPKNIAGDDLASLTYVMISRFKLDSSKLLSDDQLPDILILDGSELQLSILNKIAQQYPNFAHYLSKIQFCWLAKWAARSSSAKTYWASEQLITRQSDWSLIHQDLIYDPTDRILIKLRDEAHRFANRYRTKQMSQELK